MEYTRITFETAKLAKEKGWNGDFVESHKILTSQSLLTKWLREEYNLHITINVGLPHNCFIMYYSNVIKFGKHHKSKFKSEFCKTYEEALEIGLQEALKLIK